MLKKSTCLLLSFFAVIISSAQKPEAAANWAEKTMAKMTLEEKVGQLIVVRVPTNMTKKQQRDFEKNFDEYHVGGICFFKGTATDQLRQTKHYQQMSKVPLMVTIDGEWGLGMRLSDCYSFPRQMMMGALSNNNDTLIAQFGEEVGIQCRKMGIHVNFAPVCDINNNPSNPVIGSRSFGENKKRVARKSALYALAMQRKGVIAVAKHFPGHGDTDIDSHQDLPVIKHSAAYIDSVDLFPFRHLVKSGIRAVMVAHLQVNALDNRKNMPSSLSERIVSPILREQMGFEGLIFTDGIDMKAVSNNYKDGEGAIKALSAGCDIILLPINVDKTISAIVHKAKKDANFSRIIDEHCLRVLREKYRCQLDHLDMSRYTVPTEADKNRCKKITLEIARKALTLVRNNDTTLPFDRTDDVVNLHLGKCDSAITAIDQSLKLRIRAAGRVVLHLHATIGSANNYGVSRQTITLINEITSIENVKSVLIIYGSPYILQSFPRPLPVNASTTANALNAVENAINNTKPGPSAIIVAYQDMEETATAVDAALYGDIPFEGKLPVTTGNYPEGISLKAPRKPKTTPYDKLRENGMDVNCFVKIDSIALRGIAAHAYPGCQILVAKDGQIVYNQCYGHQTYDDNSPLVDTNTIYDLASLTKITATTLAVMKLVDAGKISLDDHLSRYLPYLKHTNKNRITIRQALSHIARLKAFDAYWKPALSDSSTYIGLTPPENFTAIGDNYYIDNNYRNKVLSQIAKSKLEKTQKYVYSDLGFILLADMVEHVSGQRIDIFMQQHFYGPLQMHNTCFQPIQHGFKAKRIAPTENDNSFRNQQLRGYVHDPNAAAMGGIAGHAGLFSTANDLFKLCQMMLDEGYAKGQRFVSAETFQTFNSRHFAGLANRRALGFDKPFINGNSTHISPKASQNSFGHTGFTGTMIWIDPEYHLIYIFLSNRVYPNATTNKLASMNIRTDIQELIYKSVTNKE